MNQPWPPALRAIRALVCHAISAEAERFHLHHAFVESPIEPMTVMLNVAKLARAMESAV